MCITLSASPYPVSPSTSTGRPLALASCRMKKATSSTVRMPRSGKPIEADIAAPDRYSASKPAALACSAAMPLCAPGSRRMPPRSSSARRRSPAGCAGQPAASREGMLRLSSPRAGIEIDMVIPRSWCQPFLVERDLQDLLLALGCQGQRQMGAELGFEQRQALGAPALVADRIGHQRFGQAAAVGQCDRQRVGDGALVRVMVVAREGWLLDAFNLGPQRIDARVGGHCVLIVVGRQAPED